jgi:hypothetical protein
MHFLQFVPYDPSVQVRGSAILTFTELLELHRPDTVEILDNYKLRKPQPEEWYPQKSWLDALKEISKRIGPTTLYVMGTKIYNLVNWPTEANDLQRTLMAIDRQHQMNHRNGKSGNCHLTVFESEGHHAKVTSDTPYPCDFERGIIMSIVMHFKGENPHSLWVVHENPYSCRNRGADSCTYLIRW